MLVTVVDFAVLHCIPQCFKLVKLISIKLDILNRCLAYTGTGIPPHHNFWLVKKHKLSINTKSASSYQSTIGEQTQFFHMNLTIKAWSWRTILILRNIITMNICYYHCCSMKLLDFDSSGNSIWIPYTSLEDLRNISNKGVWIPSR